MDQDNNDWLRAELLAKDSQILALREVLEYIHKRNESNDGPWPASNEFLGWLDDKCEEALSTPAPAAAHEARVK